MHNILCFGQSKNSSESVVFGLDFGHQRVTERVFFCVYKMLTIVNKLNKISSQPRTPKRAKILHIEPPE